MGMDSGQQNSRMTSYTFKCNKCGAEFEKFRFGFDRLKQWKEGKLKVECTDSNCKSTDVKQIIPKGSGIFKKFSWL